MRLSKYIDRETDVRRQQGKPVRAKPSIATHRAFLPILTLWGAALFGLSVMVMAAFLVDRVNAVANLPFSGMAARLAVAGFAALLGGALSFVVGGAVRSAATRNDTSRPLASAIHSRKLRLIDPANELGSDSLDAPIVEMPFGGASTEAKAKAEAESDEAEFEPISQPDTTDAERKPTLGELSQRGYRNEEPLRITSDVKGESDGLAFTHKHFQSALIESCEGATCEASPAPEDDDKSPISDEVGSPDASEPEAPETSVAPAIPRRPAPRPVPTLPSALEKLRQTPTEQLSLVEMVERFAGALHEHQKSERGSKTLGADAALVEALKALTLFTEAGFDARTPEEGTSVAGHQLGETERELRNALAKLQSLRGAA